MPPTFLYGLAFGLWLCLACVVWLASFCLLVAPVTRSMGKRLALAMVATFPGVFAFQLLASPIIVCTVAATVFAATIIDPSRSSDTTKSNDDRGDRGRASACLIDSCGGVASWVLGRMARGLDLRARPKLAGGDRSGTYRASRQDVPTPSLRSAGPQTTHSSPSEGDYTVCKHGRSEA